MSRKIFFLILAIFICVAAITVISANPLLDFSAIAYAEDEAGDNEPDFYKMLNEFEIAAVKKFESIKQGDNLSSIFAEYGKVPDVGSGISVYVYEISDFVNIEIRSFDDQKVYTVRLYIRGERFDLLDYATTTITDATTTTTEQTTTTATIATTEQTTSPSTEATTTTDVTTTTAVTTTATTLTTTNQSTTTTSRTQGGGSVSPMSYAVRSTPTPTTTPTPTPTTTPTTTPEPSPTPNTTSASSPTPNITATQIPTPKDSNKGAESDTGYEAKRKMTDIQSTHWAFEFIDGLVPLGIINGYPMDDGTFEYRPENPISRAEMAKLLIETKGLDLNYDFDGLAFADWDEVVEWARPYIAVAVESGILVGSAEESGLHVLSEDFIIREQMIAMTVRALEVSVPEGGESYVSDFDTVSDWAKDYIAFAVENGMINVDDDNSVRPHENATRAEAAMILYMLIQYMD